MVIIMNLNMINKMEVKFKKDMRIEITYGTTINWRADNCNITYMCDWIMLD